MGLDMYLYRYERYKDATANDIEAVENYIGYCNRPIDDSMFTFKEWCGIDKIPSQDFVDHYSPMYTEKPMYDMPNYSYKRISEAVGYWRKANHIHNWFVENVQNGKDDCGIYEVSREKIIELMTICGIVLHSCEMEDGVIYTGTTHYADGTRVRNYVDGKVIKDETTAKRLLPTVSGFFFGSEEYNEWYVQDIKNTIYMLSNILATTDFDKQMICYQSSW